MLDPPIIRKRAEVDAQLYRADALIKEVLNHLEANRDDISVENFCNMIDEGLECLCEAHNNLSGLWGADQP